MLHFFFFFQAEDGIRDFHVTGVQTCALPIWTRSVRIDEAMGSLVKVMLDHAAESSAGLSALPVAAASAVLASACAAAGDELMKLFAASWAFKRPVTTEECALRKDVLTTSNVVENWPFGHWVFSLTRTWP